MIFNPIRLHAHNPGPMTGTGNNTYLLIGGDGTATLIDAGQGRDAHLAEIASALDRSGARLARILVTHAHPDHAFGAIPLSAAYPGASLLKMPWPGQDRKYPVPWTAVADEDSIEIGGATLRAIHTPGHSPDHLAFWHDETRTVFAGDLVMPSGSVMIHATRGGDMGEYLRSLQRLLALGPARLLPAHGDPVNAPAGLLTRTIVHRLARERSVVAALSAGLDTVQAIAESIYDGLDPALMPAAHENVRAHLDKLRRDGRATEADGRWTT